MLLSHALECPFASCHLLEGSLSPTAGGSRDLFPLIITIWGLGLCCHIFRFSSKARTLDICATFLNF